MSDSHANVPTTNRAAITAAIVAGIVLLACIGSFVAVSLVAISEVPWHHLSVFAH